jgi:hypothetical protein
VVYISAPAPAAPQPAVTNPQPPQEIHHHTTVHHVSRVSSPVRGLSFFGVAGLVLGGLGCAAAYAPGAENFVRPLALAGMTAGGLGLLSAILFGRSGRGVPVLALIVSMVGYGIWFQHSGGQWKTEMQKMQQALPAQLPKIDLGKIESKIVPAIETPAIAPAQTVPAPVVVAPAPAPTDLESVREAAAERMGLDYKSAKRQADETRAEVVQLRQTSEPGSPELIAADQKATAADSALKAIEQKLRTDPTVAAAERAEAKRK